MWWIIQHTIQSTRLGETQTREWVQDDPFAFEKLNLLTKLSNYLFKITHALITIIVMLHIYHSSALQNISKYMYVSGQGLWSSKISLRARGGLWKKQVNIFWKDNLLHLSFPYSLFLLLSISFYCRTHINSNFTFLPSSPHRVINW